MAETVERGSVGVLKVTALCSAGRECGDDDGRNRWVNELTLC